MTKPLDREFFTGCTIAAGAVRKRDLCYLVITNDALVRDGTPYMRIYTVDRGELGGWAFDWAAIACGVCEIPGERFIAISPSGIVHVLGGGENTREKNILAGKSSPKTRGPLRKVRGVKGHAYAVGTDRQIYRREAPNRWICLDAFSRSKKNLNEKNRGKCIESVDGFAKDDLLAVGWDGEIWHFDGESWRAESSGTDLTLFDVACADDRNAYACGQSGTLLRRSHGKNSRWEKIKHRATGEDFRSVICFSGRVYVSTMSALFVLDGEKISPVKYGVAKPKTSGVLSARDGLLWSIGEKNVMEFDGNCWRSVLNLATKRR